MRDIQSKNIGDTIEVAIKGTLGTFELDAGFVAPASGVTVLFGPSGCGKTSVLRAIAGLNHMEGRVRIGAQDWQNSTCFLPVYKRPIGYVFQEASLFPHLSVSANLKYGMSKNGDNTSLKFEDVVTMLGLGGLISRAPAKLSGGERQRVAIGRALLSEPSLLLMDEPLSALDNAMREEIMPFLLRLRDQLRLPIFYITHDMAEVEQLADHLVLMEAGKVIASGPLETLQANPHLPLAKARNAAVSLDATILGWDKKTGLTTLSVQGGKLLAPLGSSPKVAHPRVRIAANDVSLAVEKPGKSSILNVLCARIVSATALGPYEMLVSLALGEKGEGAHILCRITTSSWITLTLQEGQQVYAQIKGVALVSKR